MHDYCDEGTPRCSRQTVRKKGGANDRFYIAHLMEKLTAAGSSTAQKGDACPVTLASASSHTRPSPLKISQSMCIDVNKIDA